jgi:hypothetical protein
MGGKRLFLKVYAYWLMVGALDPAGGCALRVTRWLTGMNDLLFSGVEGTVGGVVMNEWMGKGRRTVY